MKDKPQSSPAAYGYAAGLAVLVSVISLLTPWFGNPDQATQRAPLFSCLQIIAGILYLLVLWALRKSQIHLRWILLIGFWMRLAAFFSTPVLEDDYHRYFWDGAVTANGMNPYSVSPQQALETSPNLDERTEEALHNINYPAVRSVYPPVAQLAFALAYRIAPFSLLSWRLVLLGFDLLTLWLIALIASRLQLPRAWLAIYWLNPLLIRVTYNSVHMDQIVLPFVLGAFYFLMNRRHLAAASTLALAVGAKIWPIALLPILLSPIRREPRKLLAGAGVFVAVCGVLFAPVLISGVDRTSGFVVYAAVWEMNDAFFQLVHAPVGAALRVLEVRSVVPGDVARAIVALLILGIALMLLRRETDSRGRIHQALGISSLVFLLGPTPFPWYFLWVLPLLAVCPKPSLLLLTALLPLYDLRFYLDAAGHPEIFDYGIVWLEFLPVPVIAVFGCRAFSSGREAWCG